MIRCQAAAQFSSQVIDVILASQNIHAFHVFRGHVNNISYELQYEANALLPELLFE